ncbi:uncharacterized protein LOC117318627 [Pecten maximus]|uniref:uncharacterized protein LOC117318627 n=1 Tax=Pecten maximus TaxID=6579 RepID=UPI001458CEDF|nr:uncharacterized protein LOC117318627 [Pecten maximus]
MTQKDKVCIFHSCVVKIWCFSVLLLCCAIFITAMSKLHDLIGLGKEMGYEGTQLQEFIREEQAKEREDREKEREERKAAREAEFALKMEAEKKAMLAEQAKIEAERESRAKREAEDKVKLLAEEARIEAEREVRAEEKAQKEHLRKMELIQAGMVTPEQPSPATYREPPMQRGPKLPAFDESKDNMDAYIHRFERYATAQHWKRDDWGANLSGLLKGKALDVFSRLPVQQSLDFKELKKALLKRFDLTDEGFRKKFRTARPEGGETFSQFAIRIDNYLQRWIELTKTEKAYAGFKDLILRDQILYCCNQDLLLFLKERIPSSTEEMARLADQFVQARGTRANVLTSKGHGQKVGHKTPSTGPSSFGNTSTETSTSATKPSGGSYRDKQCFYCKKLGHIERDCRKKKAGENRVASITRSPLSCHERSRKHQQKTSSKTHGSTVQDDSNTQTLSLACNMKVPGADVMPVVFGRVEGKMATVLRDAGCDGIGVKRSLVDPDKISDQVKNYYLADGSLITCPLVHLDVDTPYFKGYTEAFVLDSPLDDVIIGNVKEALPVSQPDQNWKMVESAQAVETRAQVSKKQRPYKSLKVPECIRDIGSVEELKEEQQNDATLEKFRKLALKGESYVRDDGGRSIIFYHKDLMYREFQSPRVANGKVFRQLIVPEKYRQTVMKLAHEAIMSGHLAAKRTSSRVLSEFFWPGIQGDVTRFCRSCDVCQRTFPKGRVPKAPLGSIPLIDTPFKRIAVDLVGPLEPATYRGNRYILTVVDYATRYPEAVALKGIENERVAEALVEIFSRVGVPMEMLTDQGAQFTSNLMKEISRVLSIRQLTTTPYHPQCNGLVERFNGTLKQMLRKMSAERPKDWDRYLNSLLFAYREVPQESLGFSPFEMLYGRAVRGPMMILKELLTKEIPDDEIKTTYQYVIDLKEKMEETCQIAMEHLKDAKVVQRRHFNRRAKSRELKAGDKVLVLLPTKANKLLLQWRGPFEVIEKVGAFDYRINQDGKTKTLHINLLKKYLEAERNIAGEVGGILACVMTTVISEEQDQEDDIEFTSKLEVLPSNRGKENVENVEISAELTDQQRDESKSLMDGYRDVLTDLPGKTNLAVHEINTSTTEPVHVKPYPLPFNTKETIREEVEKMLEMDIIEPSISPYSAPVVLIKKKDGTNRFCIDFRRLNQVTIFDAEPMPNTEEIFARVSSAKFFSKLDLSKGYWQVPLSTEAKPMTAFSTPQGLFQFRMMPFGLMNAPATFSRLMRKLLRGMEHIDNFIDRILIYTDTWEEHMDILQELFKRLREVGLTARPSKCAIGFGSLPCLGHIVGNGRLQLEGSKVAAIENAPPPTTKKQVRSFLGLAGFYRRFIANFAAIAVPLTDLTKKGNPTQVKWETSHEMAYTTLKRLLTAKPVLKLPDLDQEFILRTDASNTGLGAVPLQEENGQKMPVAYASRKLLPREKNYAIVEKECLAIVWAVQTI